MREVKYTARFKRDYRREKSGRQGNKLDALLMEVVNLLADDTPLPRRNFDHPLSGEKRVARRCALFSAPPRLFKQKRQSRSEQAHIKPHGLWERPQRSAEDAHLCATLLRGDGWSGGLRRSPRSLRGAE